MLTTAIHATGIAFMAFATVSIRVRMESRNRLSLRHVFAIIIGVVGLLLAALYEIEVALWAAAYWWFGTLNSPEEAILYFVDSIGARGASGFLLECHWRTMAHWRRRTACTVWHQNGLQFIVMQAYWALVIRPHCVKIWYSCGLMA